MSRRRTAAAEAKAYLRSALLAASRAKVRRNTSDEAEIGVLFVHGFAANATQFRALRMALEPTIDWFDTFSYNTLTTLPKLSRRLADHITSSEDRCKQLVVIGHSLGGVLLSMVLQSDDTLDNVAGFISICAPLHGTRRSRFSPAPQLRALKPGGALVTDLSRSRDRLERWRGSILTIGVERDQFVTPADSALIDGHESLMLPDTGHVASLFDPRVHAAIGKLIAGLPRPIDAAPATD